MDAQASSAYSCLSAPRLILFSHSRALLSTALGYLSILAWLFAQMPQLIENWKRGSVEGLALPFLVSWLCGDATNLLGCVLTHQLPFQTYLATYFVLVDVGLLSQYIYYSQTSPVPVIPPLARRTVRISRSESWAAARSRSKRRRAKRRQDSYDASEDPMAQSWMSESSATSPNAPSRPFSLPPSSSLPASILSHADSFTDHETDRGRSRTRPAVPGRHGMFATLETISGSPASGSPGPGHFGLMGHGHADELSHVESRRNPSSTSRSRPAPPSRRATSMIFLSVGMLFTFGRWQSGPPAITPMPAPGRAWKVSSPDTILSNHQWDSRHPDILFEHHRSPEHLPPSSETLPLYIPSSSPAPEIATLRRRQSQYEQHPPKRDWERFIGRASAWLCTSLYLTSRLPQIWQNFRRRSVEGLSMLLFIMAFVGNSLYVMSILTHPLLSSPGYLLESTPYLLGSGGTLCFDVTIVVQSYLYSDKRKARRTAHRHVFDPEESAALLNGDHEETDDLATDGTRTPREGRRSRSVSQGGSIGGRARSAKRQSSTSRRERGDSTPLTSVDSFGSSFVSLDGPIVSEEQPQGGALDEDRSTSRGSRSRQISGESFLPIAEEGESTVTLRG